MATKRADAKGKRKTAKKNGSGMSAEVRELLHGKRKGGRPKGGYDSAINWVEIEHAYIHGIQVDHDPDDDSLKVPERRWPTYRELAKQHGCSQALICQRSKRYQWITRRDAFRQKFIDELDAHLAEDLATSTAAQVAILDRFTAVFSRNLYKDRVRADNIADLDKALRLREFLLGHADTRGETQHVISLDEMQKRHREAREKAAELDPAEAGLVVESKDTTPALDVPPAPHAPPLDADDEVPPAAAEIIPTRQERLTVARKDSARRAPFDPLTPNRSCRLPENNAERLAGARLMHEYKRKAQPPREPLDDEQGQRATPPTATPAESA